MSEEGKLDAMSLALISKSGLKVMPHLTSAPHPVSSLDLQLRVALHPYPPLTFSAEPGDSMNIIFFIRLHLSE